MKLNFESTHQYLPRQLPGNVSPDVIAQLDFSIKTTLVPLVWAVVLIEAVIITVVVVARLIVRRVVIGRLFKDDGMYAHRQTCPCTIFLSKADFVALDHSSTSSCQLVYIGILRDYPRRYDISFRRLRPGTIRTRRAFNTTWQLHNSGSGSMFGTWILRPYFLRSKLVSCLCSLATLFRPVPLLSRSCPSLAHICECSPTKACASSCLLRCSSRLGCCWPQYR